MKNKSILKNLTFIFLFLLGVQSEAQKRISSLSEFRAAVKKSNQNIILEAGDYYLENLPKRSRVIDCAGSNNTIDMTGARIYALVGSIRETYFTVSGDDNVFRNGAIEDYYGNGQSDDIKNYSAYNNNPDLAYGLRGAAVMTIFGDDNLVQGLELIVRGSDPYGYGSIYGIGRDHTFSLDKRCGLLITGREGGGRRNTLDGVTMYQNAFGHGIFMQDKADGTVIKNCYVEGRMRLSADLYNDVKRYDYPFRSKYKIAKDGTSYELPFKSPVSIPKDVMYPLSEDGIRSYGGSGSVRVENSTVKQMRGGIRLYLASKATVVNSKAIDCGATNFNMPNNGKVTGSSGNFTFGPINDNRLGRSRQDLELTIIPSPNATGPHNIADITGNGHKIVFRRTPGPLDTDETRAIVVTGDNSTIVNETEYKIILERSANGNKIISCGEVINRGSRNDVSKPRDCGNDSPPPTDGNTVHITKRNASNFAIDGGKGGANRQNIYLSSSNSSNKNQQWNEINRGNGFYSYKKKGTNFCIDGGNGGINRQNVYLWTCNDRNQNQHWKKVSTGSGNFKLIKRNASGYAIDGGNRGANGQNIGLYNSSNPSQNLQWRITPVNTENKAIPLNNRTQITESLELYPNPVKDVINIEFKGTKTATVSILNLTGQRVYSGVIKNGTNAIQLETLDVGMYILKIIEDAQVHVHKIIIDK